MSSKGQKERTHDGIRIIPTEGFSKESFSVDVKDTELNEDKNTKSIPFSGPKGRTLVLKAKDVLCYGVQKNKKFGRTNYSVAIALFEQYQPLQNALEVIHTTVQEQLELETKDLLYRGTGEAKAPKAYVRFDPDTVLFDLEGNEIEKLRDLISKKFRMDVVIRLDNVFVSNENKAFIQARIHELRVVPDHEYVRPKRKPRAADLIDSEDDDDSDIEDDWRRK